jgi:adenosylmethionine-8-amino-7-oxononanoate aminotransferase
LTFDEARVAVDEAPDTRAAAQRLVRHFLADFSHLETAYPGLYPRLVVRADGAYVWDDSGRRLLDAGGHLGACQIGHGRAEIAERMATQARALDFIALDSGLSHPKAVDLAQRLATLVPVEDAIFSFTSSGSESNELAFKIARAYHHRRGDAQRTVILSRDGSYHGSTFGGISATGAEAFRTGFGPLVGGFAQIPQPSPGRCGYCTALEGCNLRCADALEAAIDGAGPENIAAVVAEPVAILQAVKIPHPEYWDRVQAICRQSGALLIVDEVVTGFGRTGRWFGSEHWDIRPDIVTLAKGLTSGYIPLGATVVSRRVEDAFRDSPLLHLNTYAGHPVACEAALATIEILERERLPEHAAELEPVLGGCLAEVAERIPQVLRTSVIGLLSSVEVDVADRSDGGVLAVAVRHAMYEQGVLARCSAADGVLSVVFYPALTVDEEDLHRGVAAVRRALELVLEDTSA